MFGESKKPHTPSHCSRCAPHNLRYVKCLLRFSVAASRNSNLKALPRGHVLAASALRAYAPLHSCPHFVSESVRYARVNLIILFSPTAVRGHALALPCACAHSNTPAQLQKNKNKIMENKKRSPGAPTNSTPAQ